MSLLRQRAIDVSAESTFSAGRPLLARAWFVSVMSSDSSAGLNVFADQPKTCPGVANTPSVLSANAAATSAPERDRDRAGHVERIDARLRSIGDWCPRIP